MPQEKGHEPRAEKGGKTKGRTNMESEELHTAKRADEKRQEQRRLDGSKDNRRSLDILIAEWSEHS